MKSILKNNRPARDGEFRSSFDRKNQNGPAFDWNFQSSAPVLRGGAGSLHHANRVSLAGFRAMSSGFFEAEAKREYRLEAAGFAVLTALALWPIVQAAQALLDLIK